MSKVIVAARFENPTNVFDFDSGRLTASQIRRIEVNNAVVDSDVSGLLLPKWLIAELGLHPSFRFGRFTIQGRGTSLDVGEVDDSSPVIIGRIPLLALDWVIDPEGQRLIGNPEHGGQDLIDVFQEECSACPS